MSKYALKTPSGRVEEALRFLGMSGPLAMTEDALEALDDLHERLAMLSHRNRWVHPDDHDALAADLAAALAREASLREALAKARAFVAGVDLHGGAAAEPGDQWRHSLLPVIDEAVAASSSGERSDG